MSIDRVSRADARPAPALGRAGVWSEVGCIVADGGASGCRLAAFSSDGKRLASVVIDDHASLTLGAADAWRHLSGGIDRLASLLGVESAGQAHSPGDLPPLVFGLAGALQTARRADFEMQVRRTVGDALRLHVVTDGHAQLLGSGGGQPAACLALGTGSVLHWLDRAGRFGMAGGWGYPVGDEGSGAWLGASALRRYLWHCDGDTAESTLMTALAEQVGSETSDIQGWSASARSSVQARLARLVVAEAERGDALAVSLMEEGAGWCQRLIDRAPEDIPLHVVGGLANAYRPYLQRRIGDRLCAPVGDALDGLAGIAREVFSL